MEKKSLKWAMSGGWIFDHFDIFILLTSLKLFQKKILYVIGKLKEQRTETFQAFLFLIMFSLKYTARKLEKIPWLWTMLHLAALKSTS